MRLVRYIVVVQPNKGRWFTAHYDTLWAAKAHARSFRSRLSIHYRRVNDPVKVVIHV